MAHDTTMSTDGVTRLQAHEIAAIFPLLDSEELSKLSADIAANGLRHPVILFEGKILDGRNRYLACELANVEPTVEEFDGDLNAAVAFVVSENVHRRHMTTSQRAMVAARLANLTKGRPPRAQENGENSPFSQSQVAEQAKVSRDSVKFAKSVIESGTPDLVDAVERGDLSVSLAAKVAKLPEDEQREVVAAGPAAARKKAAAPVKREELSPEQEAVRSKLATDTTFVALAAGVEKLRAAAGHVADATLTDAQRELGRDIAREVRTLADWLDTLFSGQAAVTDEDLANLIEDGQ